ncbi:hypothetical protein JTE90_002311 [Oedothorax gibbosus]|uniref:Uncharacterized protein n=1 Tax=Oedothorax gibbosus TaxID=931172 RepID=A0AAV6UL97_9ARAC|nr:hypothetical protein JTE90_002311 [Oedothorax gibbosus]
MTCSSLDSKVVKDEICLARQRVQFATLPCACKHKHRGIQRQQETFPEITISDNLAPHCHFDECGCDKIGIDCLVEKNEFYPQKPRLCHVRGVGPQLARPDIMRDECEHETHSPLNEEAGDPQALRRPLGGDWNLFFRIQLENLFSDAA